MLAARDLVTRRAHAHRTRRCWRWGGRKKTNDLAVEAQAFVAKEVGKFSVMVGEDVGGGEL